MPPPLAWYREFAPCSALRPYLRALFSFMPRVVPAVPGRQLLREIALHDTTLCPPQIADGHVSLVFELGRMWQGGLREDAGGLRGTVVGPMSSVGRTDKCDYPEMLGAFFWPAQVSPFLHVPLSGLVDKAVSIDDVWGPSGGRLAGELRELDEPGRLERLESVLLAQLASGTTRARSVDVGGLAASVLRRQGRVTVDVLAGAAGVSRQHLAREFRSRIGIAPKLYCRIARFQSGLKYARSRGTVDWAQAAHDLGYVDQSHLIADFRQFSGLTPQELATREWFHPFIERAKGEAPGEP